jgi:MFS superfamily sulfate permease-like transporter
MISTVLLALLCGVLAGILLTIVVVMSAIKSIVTPEREREEASWRSSIANSRTR